MKSEIMAEVKIKIANSMLASPNCILLSYDTWTLLINLMVLYSQELYIKHGGSLPSRTVVTPC